MNQSYLEIARTFMARHHVPGSVALRDKAIVEDVIPPAAAEPEQVVAFAAYRPAQAGRSCRFCGHSLSVVAVRDICGRCTAKELLPEPPRQSSSAAIEDERQMRGRLLADLDRRGYPRLRLLNGSATGPGLLAWGPVLREMNTDELLLLEKALATSRGAVNEVIDL